MLFNSPEYLVFIVLVLLAIWNIKDVRLRNIFLLIASYFFYGFWDYRFLGLIIFSSFCDFQLGKLMGETEGSPKRKRLLYLSIGLNIGLLAYFKYCNFFIDSAITGLGYLGIESGLNTLNIILPVGISFYTFQTLSYTIDVYRKKINPTQDWIAFFAFVSFFPQLVAGPIERASALLPQFQQVAKFREMDFVQGLRQILWGLFKKIVIADQCAVLVNDIFAQHSDYSSFTLFLGAVLFSFQIYGDFSGYSDIAIGSAKLLGFKLQRNFAYPYFSRDIAEFWRRWHISLSTWFRDYLYIPLGGSKVENRNTLLRNIFIIFLVSGFWHGANWTFIIWGFIHALLYVPLVLTKKNRKHLGAVAEEKLLPNFREILSISLTFLVVTLAWVFFRAESLSDALLYLKGISALTLDLGELLSFANTLFFVLPSVLGMVLIEWCFRQQEYPFAQAGKGPLIRWTYYLIIGVLILIFGGENTATFIYFQF